MSQDGSFFSEVMRRRVPQLVGVYVAATWMMVEIGDWASERLGASADLTTMLFVIMAAMLPSVVLFAWNHGAPGRDRWLSLEKIFIPMNIIAAVFLARFVLPAADLPDPTAPAAEPPAAAATAMETRTIVDEDGAEQVFEVPAIDYYQRVGIFPFEYEGPEEQAWLAYGAPYMLQADVNRSSFIDLDSLYEVTSADQLREAGFETGLGLPQALRLRWLRDRLTSQMIEGRVVASETGYVLDAELLDVDSGETLATYEVSGTDIFDVLEDFSDELRDAVTPDLPEMDAISTDLPLAEHFTASLEAAKLFVAARSARFFANDYATSVQNLQEAVTIDPSFAVAYASLANTLRAAGQVPPAVEAYEKALSLDYKLSSEQRFIIKANRYGASGQTDRAIRVLEMLVEVHPFSANAYALLANNLANVDRPEDAEAAFLKVRELDPSQDQVLIALADLSLMVRAYDQANAYVTEYLETYPDDTDAMLRLGRILWLTGDTPGSINQIERASLIASDDFEAELALARIEKWAGDYESALARIERLVARELGSVQRVQAGSAQIELLQLRGQIGEALALVDDLDQAAGQAMPPVQRIFTIVSARATLLMLGGDFEGSMAELDEVATQVQPPFDGFLNMSRMTVQRQAERPEAFRESLGAFAEFVGQFQFPFVDGFLVAGRAYEAYLDGQYDVSIERYQEAIAIFQRSPLGLIDSYVADYYTTELAAALRAAGRVDEALIETERHLGLYRVDNFARIEHVENLIAAGRMDEAREELAFAREIWAPADPGFIGLARLDGLEAKLGEASVAAN
ncbi:MAG: tetratricopeptide repeat protein [Pseudomonadota bacterium]